jgi:hypothetical protein
MAAEGRFTVTHASAERVWQIWSDPPTWPQWNPDVVSVALDGPFAVGTTGTMVTRRMTHKIAFTAISPGTSFTLRAKPVPGTILDFTCTIEKLAVGSRIGQSVMVSGPLSLVMGNPMAKQIAASFDPILAALKARAEQS